MEEVEEIRALIDANKTEEAIRLLDGMIGREPQNDTLLFLRGNAYRKRDNWKMAISDYCKAADINPAGPAAAAYRAAIEILEFRNTDLLNP